MTKNQDRLQHLFVVYEDGSTEYVVTPLTPLLHGDAHVPPGITASRARGPMQELENMHAGEDKRAPRKVAKVYETCVEEMKAGMLPYPYEDDVKNGKVPAPHA